MKRLHVIDSHTGGEPTRLVMDGFPALAGATIADQLHTLRSEHDQWRRACLLEPVSYTHLTLPTSDLV